MVLLDCTSARLTCLVVDVTDMSDDVVAVQEFLLTDVAFVVSFPSVALHVTSELSFGVEAEPAKLREIIF